MIGIVLGIGIPLLYLTIGLFGGRFVYRWRVRNGKHDGYASSFERETSRIIAGVTVFLWPYWSLYGLYFLARRFVTANPPPSPRELRDVREGMERRIRELERELRIK